MKELFGIFKFCIHFVNNFAFRNCYTYIIDIKKGENYE